MTMKIFAVILCVVLVVGTFALLYFNHGLTIYSTIITIIGTCFSVFVASSAKDIADKVLYKTNVINLYHLNSEIIAIETELRGSFNQVGVSHKKCVIKKGDAEQIEKIKELKNKFSNFSSSFKRHSNYVSEEKNDLIQKSLDCLLIGVDEMMLQTETKIDIMEYYTIITKELNEVCRDIQL